MKFSVSVVLPAGGTGQRMNIAKPKQFQPICGKPLIYYTLSVFSRYDIIIWFWFWFILKRAHFSLWSIVLRCDDHTSIFTCDGCAWDPYFYVPAETQSYVIKLSCSRKDLESPCRQRGLNSEPLGYNDLESATLSTAPARHMTLGHMGAYDHK